MNTSNPFVNKLNQENKVDGVVIERRPKSTEILNYLNHCLNHLTSLDYVFDAFDSKEMFDVLNTDLPNVFNQSDKDCFLKDVVRLSELFIKKTISKRFRLQIEIIKTDMCRLFHVDNNRQRLLCTYLGPGTEWLENANANRRGLGKGCNNGVVKDFDKINRAKNFSVLLLKGKKYAKSDVSVIHRSPPISGKGITRVLLKIDELEVA
jgi:hypothetical protein